MVLATCLRELTAHAAGTYLAGGRRIVYRRAGENACARRHGIICVRRQCTETSVCARVSASMRPLAKSYTKHLQKGFPQATSAVDCKS